MPSEEPEMDATRGWRSQSDCGGGPTVCELRQVICRHRSRALEELYGRPPMARSATLDPYLNCTCIVAAVDRLKPIAGSAAIFYRAGVSASGGAN